MPGQPQGSKITTEKEIIKRWATERAGKPAIVKDHDLDPEALRIKFNHKRPQEKIETIKWEEFFKIIDEEDLAFLYQDETVDGEVSHFYRLVHR